MNQFPAQPDGQVTLANWRRAPFNQWAFHNVRSVLPTAAINAGSWVRPLPRASRRLGTLRYQDRHGQTEEVAQVLARSNTDSFLVIQQGRIIEECYFGDMRPQDPHILMSVSKSLTALLAGVLQADGCLDFGAQVAHYIPEVAGSAYALVTVQQLLDMQVGVAFDEDYLAEDGQMIAYREATGWNPPSDPTAPGDLRSFLLTLQPSGEHGAPFRYTSPNTDLLGWVLERAASQPLGTLFSNKIWQPLGAEFDAYVAVDRFGAPRPAGGICTTMRDLARVGLMMLEHGCSDGRPVVPASWVHETTTVGDREAWTEGSFAPFLPAGQYHNKWYQFGDELGAFCGLGIHGQYLYVAPATATVIVRFGSQPLPLDVAVTQALLDLCGGVARQL